MLVPATDSRGVSHSELFVLSRGLAMLDSRFLLQRTSHKHTLHLCKATLTVCTPDLKVPDLQWTIGIFGNPDSCCLQFSWVLHKDVCWMLALQSRRTISNQENLPCLHDVASLATNSSCRSNVLLKALTFVEFRCSLHLSTTADQLDHFPQDPVLPFQTFRELSVNCNTCSATTFK